MLLRDGGEYFRSAFGLGVGNQLARLLADGFFKMPPPTFIGVAFFEVVSNRLCICWAAFNEAQVTRRNEQLLELQKKYLKEYEDVTLTAQQKILREAAERRKEILGINKGDATTPEAKKALSALDSSTRAKLADANKKDGESDSTKKRDHRRQCRTAHGDKRIRQQAGHAGAAHAKQCGGG